MTDADLAWLSRTLDFASVVGGPQVPPADRVGPARLDYGSGLFLTAGETEGTWSLRARTWGEPGPAAVHRWAIMAADAAHGLDSSVVRPERRPDPRPDAPNQRVGRAASARSSGWRRRLSGLT
jgi:hypothetical protein